MRVFSEQTKRLKRGLISQADTPTCFPTYHSLSTEPQGGEVFCLAYGVCGGLETCHIDTSWQGCGCARPTYFCSRPTTISSCIKAAGYLHDLERRVFLYSALKLPKLRALWLIYHFVKPCTCLFHFTLKAAKSISLFSKISPTYLHFNQDVRLSRISQSTGRFQSRLPAFITYIILKQFQEFDEHTDLRSLYSIANAHLESSKDDTEAEKSPRSALHLALVCTYSWLQ